MGGLRFSSISQYGKLKLHRGIRAENDRFKRFEEGGRHINDSFPRSLWETFRRVFHSMEIFW